MIKRGDGWGEAKRNKCKAAIRVLIMLCSVLKANIHFGYESAGNLSGRNKA